MTPELSAGDVPRHDLYRLSIELNRLYATALVLLGCPHRAEEFLMALIENLSENKFTPEHLRRRALEGLVSAQLSERSDFEAARAP